MAYTIADAHSALAYRLGESATPTAASELARRISSFRQAISRTAGDGHLWWFMQKFTTDATVAYRKSYDLPTRCRVIEQLKIDNTKYKEIAHDEVYKKYESPSSPVPILDSFQERAFYQWDDQYYPIPITDAAPTSITLTSLTSSGTTATATYEDHGFTSDDYVVIAGATPSTYNGTFQITVTGADTFTYTLASDPADTTTGTITATKNNIEIWYWETPSLPTATTDPIVVPDDYLDMIVAYAEGRYWSTAHKRGKAADAFAEFESLFDRMKMENERKKFLAI